MKTALITGGNAGIGKETAKALVSKGYSVIIVARDSSKGDAVVKSIKTEVPEASVEFIALDLTHFDEVRTFAQTIRERWSHIDALILNAGLFTPKLTTSESGHEVMFAATHLGHFLLTHELLPLVKASKQGRIVVTSSVAHKLGSLKDFTSLKKPSNSTALMYVPFKAYGRSKLCNLLFVRELAERLKQTSIKVNAFHPGSVKTDIWRNTPALFYKLIAPSLISELDGAQTQIFLATDENLTTSGEYWYRKQIERSSAAGRDMTMAKKLWQYSELALGIDQFGETKPQTQAEPTIPA